MYGASQSSLQGCGSSSCSSSGVDVAEVVEKESDANCAVGGMDSSDGLRGQESLLLGVLGRRDLRAS